MKRKEQWKINGIFTTKDDEHLAAAIKAFETAGYLVERKDEKSGRFIYVGEIMSGWIDEIENYQRKSLISTCFIVAKRKDRCQSVFWTFSDGRWTVHT